MCAASLIVADATVHCRQFVSAEKHQTEKVLISFAFVGPSPAHLQQHWKALIVKRPSIGRDYSHKQLDTKQVAPDIKQQTEPIASCIFAAVLLACVPQLQPHKCVGRPA